MKKYLIIGGAGFIGSHLSQKLLSLGNSVVVIDPMVPNFPEARNADFKNYAFDAKDFKKTTEVFQEESPNAVFYLAGPMNLRRPTSDPLFSKDLDYLERLSSVLIASYDSGVENMLLVSSGGAIYQNAKIVPTSEDYLAQPASAYALANLQMEDHASMYTKNNSILLVIARLGNVYGPGQWQSGFIPSMIKSILLKESPVVYGDGNQTRDFIFIDDAIEAIISLVAHASDGIYNVASGKETSLNEIFAIIQKFLGSSLGATYRPATMPEPLRSGLDIKKITQEIGWVPHFDIKKGITKTIEWYAKN